MKSGLCTGCFLIGGNRPSLGRKSLYVIFTPISDYTGNNPSIRNLLKGARRHVKARKDGMEQASPKNVQY